MIKIITMVKVEIKEALVTITKIKAAIRETTTISLKSEDQAKVIKTTATEVVVASEASITGTTVITTTTTTTTIVVTVKETASEAISAC